VEVALTVQLALYHVLPGILAMRLLLRVGSVRGRRFRAAQL